VFFLFFLEFKRQIEKTKEDHNMESKSQIDLIETLRNKLQEQDKVRLKILYLIKFI
jgi:hypothetical protein